MTSYPIPRLPLDIDLESRVVLKKTASARSALAEMKGRATGIPNESILISTLSLQEAKDSSAIENIITTHDELFQSDLLSRHFKTLASKEVHHYAQALRWGFGMVKQSGFLSFNHILQIQQTIEENTAGFRKTPGTTLKNQQTGEVVYTPPQHHDDIVAHMSELERFMNDDSLCDWDPLVKMAVIHHQFESIHPFYDGNGRTGRIINILFLVKEGLLDLPTLYLSRYINQHKGEYYRLLQQVRTDQAWEAWVLYMLDGLEQTSLHTMAIIEGIQGIMERHKSELKRTLPKIYSQDLLSNLFKHPYTKIDYVIHDLSVSRPTATRYLELVASTGILRKLRLGKDNYYVNQELYDLLASVPALPPRT